MLRQMCGRAKGFADNWVYWLSNDSENRLILWDNH